MAICLFDTSQRTDGPRCSPNAPTARPSFIRSKRHYVFRISLRDTSKSIAGFQAVDCSITHPSTVDLNPSWVDSTVFYLHQRESSAVYGGRESRALWQVDNAWHRFAHRPRRHARPTRGQSDNIGIPPPARGRHPCYSTVGGYRRKTNRSRRIPCRIGVTGAWHSLHFVGVQTRRDQINRTLAVGSSVGSDGEDVTE